MCKKTQTVHGSTVNYKCGLDPSNSSKLSTYLWEGEQTKMHFLGKRTGDTVLFIFLMLIYFH